MKTRLMAAVAVAMTFLVGCTPGQGPIYVDAIQPLLPAGTACNITPDDKLSLVEIRLLDVAAGDPDVNVILRLQGAELVKTATAQPGLSVGTTRELEPSGRDKPTSQRIVLRYTTTSKPALPGLTASLVDTIDYSVRITDKTYLPVPLFGPKAREKLNDLAASNTDSYNVLVSLEVQGQFLPSTQPWRTAPVSFPVRIVKSEVMCPGGNLNRLARFSVPNAAGAARGCLYYGVEQRYTTTQCCPNAPGSPDPLTPGCD